MAENLIVPTDAGKAEKYQALIPQIAALIEGETDLIANLANIAAAVKYGMEFFWVGFYIVRDDTLVLGPFQGPIACTRIKKGKGVCGKAWEDKQTILVEDVDQFPGHIACSSESRSEIVLPAFDGNKEVALILDVDSKKLSDFDEMDQKYLQEIMDLIEQKL